jgi:hypothetical protein
LSQHRRRSPGKRRRASRRSGFLIPVTATAISAIAGTTVAGYLAVRSSHSDVGAALAATLQPASHVIAKLEEQREQLIVMTTAARTIHLVGSPKLASRPLANGGGGAAGGGAPAGTASYPPPNPGTAEAIAYRMMASFGFNPQTQYACLLPMWMDESSWRWDAQNASGAYGIPQALPASKMATAGADWRTNPATQISWGLGYIKSVYGTPCNAWAFWQVHHYY